MNEVMLSKKATTPILCRDKDEFVKFFMQLANVFSTKEGTKEERQRDMEMTIGALKLLLHEYISLVLRCGMDPYNVEFGSDEDRDKMLQEFREGMLDITEHMIRQGVPMEECPDGRSRIMFDELKKEFKNGKN